MRFGLFGVNLGPLGAEPAAALGLAEIAERCGWESVWTGEHFVLPDPATPHSPTPPGTPFLDAFTCLAAVAARTTRLLLGTGLTIVPYHHPVTLAKRVASLDRLSRGRLVLGVGAGYLTEEFTALGVPLESRGRATDEALVAMRALWTGKPARFLGQPITGVRAEPRPVDPTGPPVVVGGSTSAAYRRALRYGRGYYGWQLTPDQARTVLAELGEERRRLDGDTAVPADQFEISLTPPRQLHVDDDIVTDYAALGVTRLVVMIPPNPASIDELADFVRVPTWSMGP